MKKTLITLISVCAFLIAFTGISFAKDALEGSKSITAQISQQNIEVEDYEMDSTMIMLGFAYFFTNNLEVKGVFVGSYSDLDLGEDGDSDSTICEVGAQANWNFFKAGWVVVPYIGPQVQYAFFDSGDDDDSQLAYGGQGGLKCFLSEDLSVNVEINYLTFSVDVDEGSDIDVDITTMWVGFSYYF